MYIYKHIDIHRASNYLTFLIIPESMLNTKYKFIVFYSDLLTQLIILEKLNSDRNHV